MSVYWTMSPSLAPKIFPKLLRRQLRAKSAYAPLRLFLSFIPSLTTQCQILFVIGDRRGQVALRLTGNPQIVIGGCMLWIEPDGLRVVGDRPGRVTLRPTGN